MPNAPKTPTRPIRIPSDLWQAAGDAAARSEPATDRSTLVREFFAWYVRLPGAKLPKRPPALAVSADDHQSADSPQDSRTGST